MVLTKFKRRPDFQESDIKKIAAKHFEFDAVTVRSLGGYIDQNFLIENKTGEKRLIKAHSRAEKPYALDLQNAVLKHLGTKNLDFETPRVFKSLNGDVVTQIASGADYVDRLRCLSFINGDLLSNFESLSLTTLYNVGLLVGKLDIALADFDHPAAVRPDMEWDITNAPRISQYVPLIEDPKLRRLASYFFLQFDEEIATKLATLPQQVSHNDGHRYSLIGRQPGDEMSVVGIIDFGDVLLTHSVCNLAVTVSDLIGGKGDLVAAAASIVSGYHKVKPLKDLEIELLYHLVGVRLAMYGAMAGRATRDDPKNSHPQAKLADVKILFRQLMAVNPIAWADALRAACQMPDLSGERAQSSKTLVEARQEIFSPSLYTHYNQPLVLDRGAFQYLYDRSGKTYLDCVNNVCQWGHCHPTIVRAAQKQIARLNTNSRYVYEPMPELADRLTSTMPDELDTVFFVNSGSEANDLAARLARAFTNNHDLVVVDRAYHGNSSLATYISPNRIDRPGRPGLPRHVRSTECPDLYRGKFRNDDPTATEKYLDDLRGVVSEMQSEGQGPAAFFAESLVGTGGQIVYPDGYLKGVYEAVRNEGGLCIADEVQVGFGRTGNHMWCFETQSVVPDIVTMGKPMGNGHPMAAVVTRREIAEAFDNGIPYFNTFGGNPVSCATGLAVLDVLQGESLMANTAEMGKQIIAGLRALQKTYPVIGDIRGLGLYIGVEIVSDPGARTPNAELAKHIVEAMKTRGILLNVNGYDNNIIKIKPPMIIDERDVDQLLSGFEVMMGRYSGDLAVVPQ